MTLEVGVEREVDAIRLPRWGQVARVPDAVVPFVDVDDGGLPVEPVLLFLRDFVARGRRSGSVRSYAYAQNTTNPANLVDEENLASPEKNTPPGRFDERCPDCDVAVGEAHEYDEHDGGCDVARCLVTGSQRLMCDLDHDCGRDLWTGCPRPGRTPSCRSSATPRRRRATFTWNGFRFRGMPIPITTTLPPVSPDYLARRGEVALTVAAAVEQVAWPTRTGPPIMSNMSSSDVQGAQRTDGTEPRIVDRDHNLRSKPIPVWVRLDGIYVRDPGAPRHVNGAGVIMDGEVRGTLTHWVPTVDGDLLGCLPGLKMTVDHFVALRLTHAVCQRRHGLGSEDSTAVPTACKS